MTTINETCELVNEWVTYKPDVHLHAYPTVDRPLEHQGVVLQMYRDAFDSRDPTRTTRIVSQELVAGFELERMTREMLLDRVRQFIHRHEMHEADEWLKLDGEVLYDPHA